MRRTGQTLIFDADDTLWENNVFFERVIDDFLDWAAHPTLDRVQIRQILNDIERANAVTHGYGSRVFLRNLHETFERLQERPASLAERERIDALAGRLVRGEVDLIPGVDDTLAELASRHELFLLTKGDPEEQQRKIDASGLAAWFRKTHIVREKDAEVYRRLAADSGFAVDRTWMIGNSPKSDIRPARQAGMGAVFIPHEHTWVLEHAELDPLDDGVLTLGRFTELVDHF
ncbi:HAD hydrolase-like protein [Herbidospora sp. NEAU-GS84]|uniref:HAD hydrolase-like protein n=1 Tax=Herbidospora solisilvae TaxID=2696284 RepID=A0A7C9J5X1_9ACTN|nr:HAD family hydrolase [Herbidospora solisilvae]NAS20488.1 HAD hydrolase-like protein [Herbidospora solisilvae]